MDKLRDRNNSREIHHAILHYIYIYIYIYIFLLEKKQPCKVNWWDTLQSEQKYKSR